MSDTDLQQPQPQPEGQRGAVAAWSNGAPPENRPTPSRLAPSKPFRALPRTDSGRRLASTPLHNATNQPGNGGIVATKQRRTARTMIDTNEKVNNGEFGDGYESDPSPPEKFTAASNHRRSPSLGSSSVLHQQQLHRHAHGNDNIPPARHSQGRDADKHSPLVNNDAEQQRRSGVEAPTELHGRRKRGSRQLTSQMRRSQSIELYKLHLQCLDRKRQAVLSLHHAQGDKTMYVTAPRALRRNHGIV